MTITRILVGALILAPAAAGLAIPASAGDFLGAYRFESTNGDTSRWTITACPSSAGCDMLVGVTDISNKQIGPFVGRAIRDGGRWNMTVDVPDSIRCELNQRTYPGRLEFSWDATMSGTVAAHQSTANCGRPAMTVVNISSFTLTKVG